jgi:hypothetical protein
MDLVEMVRGQNRDDFRLLGKHTVHCGEQIVGIVVAFLSLTIDIFGKYHSRLITACKLKGRLEA